MIIKCTPEEFKRLIKKEELCISKTQTGGTHTHLEKTVSVKQNDIPPSTLVNDDKFEHNFGHPSSYLCKNQNDYFTINQIQELKKENVELKQKLEECQKRTLSESDMPRLHH
ncbi:hypothetical protein [Pectinatus haikarae]|uniref:hypothetical protein n=1 Tax=Pectinatus haikarae TaxID=349096 RepID=UPI0018C7B5DC|nr:hypothetical protein [Pectinatus haikarae]